MSKGQIYKISKTKKVKLNAEAELKSFIVGIIIYALVLMIASSLFRGIYVSNFFFAIIAALILSLLNSTIKPVLVYLTLPLSVLTFGIAYPIVNIIILNLCDLIMGSAFGISGFFSSFFIALFISALKMFLDKMITEKVGRR